MVRAVRTRIPMMTAILVPRRRFFIGCLSGWWYSVGRGPLDGLEELTRLQQDQQLARQLGDARDEVAGVAEAGALGGRALGGSPPVLDLVRLDRNNVADAIHHDPEGV